MTLDDALAVVPQPHHADAWLTLYQGDVRDVLRALPDASVHCVVTSPPYWGLRDYGTDGQLGLEPTPEAYIESMVGVFREVRRVLRDDGTLWLNMGDAYNAGTSAKRRPSVQPSNDVGYWLKAGAMGDERVNVPALKPKDLIGMPWRLAFALQADGWYLRSDIIWSKPSPMPESVTDRPTKAHEYLFLLTKRARYYYDAEAVREPSSTTRPELLAFGEERPDRDYPGHAQDRRRAKVGNDDIRVRDRARSDVGFPGSPDAAGPGPRARRDLGPKLSDASADVRASASARMGRGAGWRADKQAAYAGTTNAGTERRAVGLNDRWDAREDAGLIRPGRNLRDVWTIASQPYPGSHFATFPEKLVEPCILAGTSAKGVCPECGAPWVRAATVGWHPGCDHDREAVPAVVMDPFGGSGTVALVAERLGRRAILVELNPAYCAQALERIASGRRDGTGAAVDLPLPAPTGSLWEESA